MGKKYTTLKIYLPFLLLVFSCYAIKAQNINSETLPERSTTLQTPLNNSPVITLKAFPNPTKNYIKFTVQNAKIYHIALVDITGTHLLSTEGNTQQSQRVDLSKFAAGVYFAAISTNKGQLVQRIVKQ